MLYRHETIRLISARRATTNERRQYDVFEQNTGLRPHFLSHFLISLCHRTPPYQNFNCALKFPNSNPIS